MHRWTVCLLLAGSLTACTKSRPVALGDADADTRIPERQREVMAGLTVPTKYDPATGFIVAQEVTPLPSVLAYGPRLSGAMALGSRESRPVLAFATADTCGPCQQYKLDAINDPRVVAFMESGRVIPVHVEVNRHAADAKLLTGGGIPMTYWIVDGEIRGKLVGLRTADELLAFVHEQAG
jgi:hypothetical protein